MKLTFTKQEIATVAQQLWEYGQQHAVWAFQAPMGAGKTTLIHALCKNVLMVQDAIGSPTYAIIHEYQSPVASTIYHMDWYRLRDEEEAIQAGVEDGLFSGHLCLVEWPEIAPALLPENTWHIHISLVDKDTRLLTTA